jgi:PST family polysaccharide transporter
LLNLIKKINRLPLVSVLSITALSTVVKIFTAFFIAKLFSIYIGPKGLGITGQLAGFIAIITVFSTGGINYGIVKYISEFKHVEKRINQIIKTSSKINLICSFLCSFVLIAASKFWSYLLFNTNEYFTVILLLGFSILFISVYSFINSILNGLGEYRKYNEISILTNISGLLMSYLLTLFFDIKGALISMICIQVIIIIMLCIIYRKKIIAKYNELKNVNEDKNDYTKMFHFALMNLAGISLIPVVQIFIRNYLNIHVNSNTVGYFEAINRISIIGITVISNTLSLYYLPRLASINDTLLLRKEIFSVSKVIIPITFLGLLLIYALRKLVISIVFTSSFIQIDAYFLPQLLGDFFRVGAYILAYQFWAKAMIKSYIFVEFLTALCMLISSVYLINEFGGIGASYSYLITQILYFIIVMFIFRKLVFCKPNQ